MTVTDTVGTSMTQVFTGQTMSRNGKATARTTGAVTISTPFTVTAASPVGFNGSITGTNQTLSTTMPFEPLQRARGRLEHLGHVDAVDHRRRLAEGPPAHRYDRRRPRR